MTKVKKAAAAFAACLCIASSAAYLSVGAAAVDTTYDVVMYGQSSAKAKLSRIKGSLYYSDKFEDNRIPVLKKNRVIKSCLEMSENDVLIIPAGKTLTLTGGANIKGTIYIEKGGKLLLDSYSVDLYGKIVCFGTVEVTGGTLYCADDSLLYVAEGGEFTAADRGIVESGGITELNGRIITDFTANVVCLGTCNIPDPTFASEPVAAVYCRQDFGGSAKKASIVTTDLAELIKVECNKSAEFSDNDFADEYSIFFSGGACVKYIASWDLSNGWSNIGGVNVQLMENILSDYHKK